MKKLFVIVIFILLSLTPTRTVIAQTPAPSPTPVPSIDLTSDENSPSPVTLTASGSKFTNGSADGICTVADAPCTAGTARTPGICVDNGHGLGVCAPVQPTIDPLFDTGCDPNDICHISPEKVGRKNDVGQQKTQGYGQKDPTGSLWSFIQNWIGLVHPQGVYHYGTSLLTAMGFDVFNSFAKDLAPAELQDQTLYDVQPKPYCMTSRLCVYDPVTHALVGNYLTRETWCTDDPPGRRELIMGSRLACGAMGKCSVGTDLRLPYTAVKKIAALPCGAKLEQGQAMELDDRPFIKTNEYGEDTITHFAITIQADMVSIVQKVINVLGGRERTVDVYQATEHTPAIDVGSAENSMASSLAGISFTVTPNDLKPFANPGPEGKAQLAQGGGIWDNYRNDAYDVAFKTLADARFESQDWFYGMAGEGNMKSPTLQSMNARQENSQKFGLCSGMNADDPRFVPLGCDQNWVAGESTTANIASTSGPSYPPSEPDTTTWASTPGGASANPIQPKFSVPSPISSNMVPSCVLEGVAKIEGAYDGGAPCSNNECGAYGPFQITTGNCKASCGASSCPNAASGLGATKDQLCDFGTASQLAARLLVGKSKYFGYNLTTADPKTQKEAIIIAGDSYYGITKPIARLGGLSYGEWVYAHCDPTYTKHVDHSFPAAGAGTHF